MTGDADGRMIVWDAKAMKEAGRLELGGRVMALAISDDGRVTTTDGALRSHSTSTAADPTPAAVRPQ